MPSTNTNTARMPFISSPVAMAMMNRYQRLIKAMLHSSSSSSSASLVSLKHNYLTVPAALIGFNSFKGEQIQDKSSEPFSIIDPIQIPGLDGSWRNNNLSCQVLAPGVVLFKNYLTILGQAGVVNSCQKWGVGPAGFYEPYNQYGHKLRRHMTCFGRNWDPVTMYNNRCTSDGSEPPAIPYELINLSNTAISDAQAYLDQLPSMSPDVCVVSFYSTAGRVGIHQDCDESADSLSRGLPVVSISVGDTAEFWYGETRDENKLSKVLLESGDVFIFGGKSRHIFHGVKKIKHSTSPLELLEAVKIRPGRLNVTLKQF